MMSSILALPGKPTVTHWELPADLSYDEWKEILFKVSRVNDASRFWLGDAYLYGESHYGESYTQAMSEVDVNEETQKRYYFVAAAIHPRIRIPELSWSHHRIVAYAKNLESEEREAREAAFGDEPSAGKPPVGEP